MEVGLFILGCIVGCGVAIFIARLKFKPKQDKPLGVIRVDRSDPDGPYLFLEFENEGQMYQVMNANRVTLDVIRENFITHE